MYLKTPPIFFFKKKCDMNKFKTNDTIKITIFEMKNIVVFWSVTMLENMSLYYAMPFGFDQRKIKKRVTNRKKRAWEPDYWLDWSWKSIDDDCELWHITTTTTTTTVNSVTATMDGSVLDSDIDAIFACLPLFAFVLALAHVQLIFCIDSCVCVFVCRMRIVYN